MNIKTIKITSISILQPNARTLFSHIQHLPWAMLLDTCNSLLISERYDILVYQPIATYEFKNGKGQFKGRDDSFDFSELDLAPDPFEALANLQQYFADHTQLEIPSDLPFILGTMGAFGYDINTLTDGIEDPNPNEYLMPDIAVGLYANSLIVDKQKGIVYHCSVENIQPDWLEPFLHKQKVPNQGFHLTSDWHSNMSKSDYVAKFNKIQDYLKAGDCYQVNLAQRFSAEYAGSEWQAYQQLSEANQAPFSAFCRFENTCVLSLSPERFLQLKNGQVVTKPIKGTRKRDSDPKKDAALAEELFNAEKDRAENLMIVDLLRNDLSKHCQPFSVKVPKLFHIESYPAVHHLVSTVEGKIRENTHTYTLLKGAFPGGSITGAPKVRAMQIIRELEPNKRSIYCGSIGYVGIQNDMDTSICIRTLLAENQRLYCWAGGGIVLDSEGEDEFQETLHKVAKILPVLKENTSDGI
ncbi:aminodeoxychorismate synthase component I [Glaciecola sp. 1036]|uniref:aminodeoxychorismate synthase component I n=1 Tax=Alteromonadaceae TaxID=72275 RepID=UPI003CFD0F20